MSANTDIFISGGGIAGLTAALAMSRLGLSVTIADPTPPPAGAEADGSDLRSTAFLQPALQLFQEFGIWDALARYATPLETLAVIDCAGDPPHPKTERAFKSSDLGEAAFGWNLPNWLTRKFLTEAVADAPGADLRLGTGFRSILTREREAIVTLDDGTKVRARLAIGADGRDSPLREAVGIPTETTRYGQKALAFTVTHDVPHENVSTELYLSGGAFTLVPLPDHNGRPASAVVWMNDGPEAARLMALDDQAFSEAATMRSCAVLGQLTLASPRRAWPVVTRRATKLVAERTALVAEAAHVLPPIGAQGLNTSLHDVRALIELAKEMPDDIGQRPWLDRYAKSRERDIHTRARVIDLYNRVCRSDAPPVQALRSLGLTLVHDVAPLRKGVMRAGLGS